MPRTAAGGGDEADTLDAAAGTLTSGRCEAGPDYRTVRSRGTATWLLTWTLAGGGRLRQGGASVAARPGEAVLLAPGTAHEYGTDPAVRHWRFRWVHFVPAAGWEARLARFAVGGGVHVIRGVAPERHERIGRTLRQIHADACWSGDGAPEDGGAGESVAVSDAGRELALAGLGQVLVLLTAEPAPVADARIRRAEALIAADPAAPHTAASLAARVALSPSRLAHLFAAETGRSVGAALREVRLQHAAGLLASTGMGVAQAARASGFASPFHFSRAFKARFGVAPSSWAEGSAVPDTPPKHILPR